jgi:hypothetical protein
MISWGVHKGRVGVSRSAAGPWLLLQLTDELDQVRVQMTAPEARVMIRRIEKYIEVIERQAKDEG